MNDPVDMNYENIDVLQLVKNCTLFLPADDIQLRKKLYDLNVLFDIWNKIIKEDYPEDVYAAVVAMFSSNVFRPLPPSLYEIAADDESAVSVAVATFGGGCDTVDGGGGCADVDDDAMAESTQTTVVYQAFQAFLDRAQFDPTKASAHVDRRFVNGLVHRLKSGDSYERTTVREIMARVNFVCPSVQGPMLDAAVAELADFAYGYAPYHSGVEEMLDFLANDVVYEYVNAAVLGKLSRIMTHLLKHQLLFSFKSKFIECVKALDIGQRDLIPQMMMYIVKLWPCSHLKTVVLLRTMIELYQWCDKDKWVPLQLHIVHHLSKLFGKEDFQLADESMNLLNCILHDNITFWQSKPDDMRIVANALIKVKRNHWNVDCAKMANNLLNKMVLMNLIKKNCLEDSEDIFQEGKPDEVNYDDISNFELIQPIHQLKLMTTLTTKQSTTV